MLVFLDTEFTRFAYADLISVGLVSEDGQEFYAERTDYDRKACTDFVRETVQPLLGRVPGSSCKREQMPQRLRDWFQQLPEPATVIYDYAGDWDLLTKMILGLPTASLEPPSNFGEALELATTTITHPVFEAAARATYSDRWPPHHALADARALMAGYRAWRAFMEPIRRIK